MVLKKSSGDVPTKASFKGLVDEGWKVKESEIPIRSDLIQRGILPPKYNFHDPRETHASLDHVEVYQNRLGCYGVRFSYHLSRVDTRSREAYSLGREYHADLPLNISEGHQVSKLRQRVRGCVLATPLPEEADTASQCLRQLYFKPRNHHRRVNHHYMPRKRKVIYLKL